MAADGNFGAVQHLGACNLAVARLKIRIQNSEIRNNSGQWPVAGGQLVSGLEFYVR